MSVGEMRLPNRAPNGMVAECSCSSEFNTPMAKCVRQKAVGAERPENAQMPRLFGYSASTCQTLLLITIWFTGAGLGVHVLMMRCKAFLGTSEGTSWLVTIEGN